MTFCLKHYWLFNVLFFRIKEPFFSIKLSITCSHLMKYAFVKNKQTNVEYLSFSPKPCRLNPDDFKLRKNPCGRPRMDSVHARCHAVTQGSPEQLMTSPGTCQLRTREVHRISPAATFNHLKILQTQICKSSRQLPSGLSHEDRNLLQILTFAFLVFIKYLEFPSSHTI